MSTNNIKEALKECANYTSEIMGNVTDKLDEKGFTYAKNELSSEIIVTNTTKKDIMDTISELENIDSSKSKLMLQVTESNEKVFIRQKFI